MDTAYTTLSRQSGLMNEMRLVANNIANANTAGFKVERLMLEESHAQETHQLDGPSKVAFVDDWAMGRDFTQGALEATGRSLDVALQGEGFFLLETPAGERYSRDGRFTMSSMGELVNGSGDRVLDEVGQPIFLDPEGGAITIGANGQITQGGLPGQRIGVVRFSELGALEKTGENQYRAPDGLEQVFEDLPQISQGALERSNVNPILEITRMIEVSRAYSSVTKMIKDTDELARKAIERLGRA